MLRSDDWSVSVRLLSLSFFEDVACKCRCTVEGCWRSIGPIVLQLWLITHLRAVSCCPNWHAAPKLYEHALCCEKSVFALKMLTDGLNPCKRQVPKKHDFPPDFVCLEFCGVIPRVSPPTFYWRRVEGDGDLEFDTKSFVRRMGEGN